MRKVPRLFVNPLMCSGARETASHRNGPTARIQPWVSLSIIDQLHYNSKNLLYLCNRNVPSLVITLGECLIEAKQGHLRQHAIVAIFRDFACYFGASVR
jgi:hypothetical protein